MSATPGVNMIGSKATWDHHVVVPGPQGFLITYENTTGLPQLLVIHIVGTNGFNYSSANVNATIVASAASGEQDLDLGVDVSAFVGLKIDFTLSMTWGPTGVENTSPVTKSGSFEVVGSTRLVVAQVRQTVFDETGQPNPGFEFGQPRVKIYNPPPPPSIAATGKDTIKQGPQGPASKGSRQ